MGTFHVPVAVVASTLALQVAALFIFGPGYWYERFPERLVETADANMDGIISVQEVLDVAIASFLKTSVEELSLLDVNHDGYLAVDEVRLDLMNISWLLDYIEPGRSGDVTTEGAKAFMIKHGMAYAGGMLEHGIDGNKFDHYMPDEVFSIFLDWSLDYQFLDDTFVRSLFRWHAIVRVLLVTNSVIKEQFEKYPENSESWNAQRFCNFMKRAYVTFDSSEFENRLSPSDIRQIAVTRKHLTFPTADAEGNFPLAQVVAFSKYYKLTDQPMAVMRVKPHGHAEEADLDHDGFLTPAEVRVWLGGSEDVLLDEHFFEVLKMGVEHFLNRVANVVENTLQAQQVLAFLGQAIENADANADGQVSLQEMLDVALGVFIKTSVEELSMFDVDHDGYLTAVEIWSKLSNETLVLDYIEPGRSGNVTTKALVEFMTNHGFEFSDDFLYDSDVGMHFDRLGKEDTEIIGHFITACLQFHFYDDTNVRTMFYLHAAYRVFMLTNSEIKMMFQRSLVSKSVYDRSVGLGIGPGLRSWNAEIFSKTLAELDFNLEYSESVGPSEIRQIVVTRKHFGFPTADANGNFPLEEVVAFSNYYRLTENPAFFIGVKPHGHAEEADLDHDGSLTPAEVRVWLGGSEDVLLDENFFAVLKMGAEHFFNRIANVVERIEVDQNADAGRRVRRDL